MIIYSVISYSLMIWFVTSFLLKYLPSGAIFVRRSIIIAKVYDKWNTSLNCIESHYTRVSLRFYWGVKKKERKGLSPPGFLCVDPVMPVKIGTGFSRPKGYWPHLLLQTPKHKKSQFPGLFLLFNSVRQFVHDFTLHWVSVGDPRQGNGGRLTHESCDTDLRRTGLEGWMTSRESLEPSDDFGPPKDH